MSRQKVLCTGNNGFIFSNFIRKAIHDKGQYSFIGVDKITNSSALNNLYFNKSHPFYIGDITDEHFVNILFEYEKPDIVIHGAALTHVDASLANPNSFIHNNVLGTQVLVNAAIRWGVKKFVLISTDEIYGQLTNEDDKPWKEDAQYNPRNPYSASKAAAEFVVKAAGASFGLNYNITRSCNNYGPRQTPDKFIPKVVKSILEGKKIPVYGQGLQMRDWLHVLDNCDAIMKVMENGENGAIYNISASQEFTNIEVVNEICKIMGSGMDLVEYVKDRPGHDFRYAIDSTKIRALGWEPSFKFRPGLASTVEWFKINPYFLK